MKYNLKLDITQERLILDGPKLILDYRGYYFFLKYRIHYKCKRLKNELIYKFVKTMFLIHEI
jgi:hypothetical protein